MIVIISFGFVLQVVVFFGGFGDAVIGGVGAAVLCRAGAGRAAGFGVVEADLGVPEGVGAFLLVFEEAAFGVPRGGALIFWVVLAQL